MEPIFSHTDDMAAAVTHAKITAAIMPYYKILVNAKSNSLFQSVRGPAQQHI